MTRRLRDKTHLRFVAKQPCLVCGRQPCDAHHLRFAQSRGLGLKVSDEFTVPLCRAHHRELHRTGREFDRGRKPISSPSLWPASFGWKPTLSPVLQTSRATTARSPERRKDEAITMSMAGAQSRGWRNEPSCRALRHDFAFDRLNPTAATPKRAWARRRKAAKQRSSQNAVRHGLTAETVIGPLEDPADYRAFEQAVTAAYDAGDHRRT